MDEHTKGIAPLRFVVPGYSCKAIFTTDAKGQYSYKEENCITFPVRDEPFDDNEELVIEITGTQKQQENICESIYEDLCTHLESDNCIFKLLIPSETVCDVKNKCQIEIDSEHFELRITPFKDLGGCIIFIYGIQE